MGKPGRSLVPGDYPLCVVFPDVLGYPPLPRVRHPEGPCRSPRCMPHLPSRRDAPWGNRGDSHVGGIIRSTRCSLACWGISLCRGFAIPKGSAATSTICCVCRPGTTRHRRPGHSLVRGLSALRGVSRRVGASPCAKGSPSRRALPRPTLHVVPAFPARLSMGKPGRSLVPGDYPLCVVFPDMLGYPPLPRIRHPERPCRSPRCMLCLPSRRDAPWGNRGIPSCGDYPLCVVFPGVLRVSPCA